LDVAVADDARALRALSDDGRAVGPRGGWGFCHAPDDTQTEFRVNDRRPAYTSGHSFTSAEAHRTHTMRWVPAGWIATAAACAQSTPPAATGSTSASSYFDNAGRADVLGGGARMIPISTPKGQFRVWTKRIGNNPKIKLLLLHGGPGATHEY